MGLVTQTDPAWRDQTGAPNDPQPGNIPGGRRDVLRSADFNDGRMSGFAPDSGTWSVSGGALFVSAVSVGGDAAAVYHVGEMLPEYYEIQASVNPVKPTAGWKSNAFIIFDYFGPYDFKFAGINVSLDKLQMGHRTPAGWIVDVQTNIQAKPDTYYNMLVAVHGLNVTLLVNNTKVFSQTFEPRIFDGFSYGLNWGMVGMGSDNSRGKFDNIAVQKLPPAITFEDIEDFTDGSADLFTGTATGSWQVSNGRYQGAPAAGQDRAVSLADLGLDRGIHPNSILTLSATLSTQARAGFVFDRYGASDFKFVAIDGRTSQVIIGHHTEQRGWAIDAAVSRPVGLGTDHTLRVSLKGTSVSVSLDGQVAAGHVFNAVAVDGAFGLLTGDAPGSFDVTIVQTDDPAFIGPAGGAALGADSEATTIRSADARVTRNILAAVVAEAWARWAQTGLVEAAEAVNVEIADLSGLTLGYTVDRTILIDVNAAGHGWFLDLTPTDDAEFAVGTRYRELNALPDSDAFGHIDFLTVIMHEMGHVLGLDHHAADEHFHELMEATLPAGLRLFAADSRTTPADGVAYGTAADGPAPHVSVSSVNQASEVNGRPFEWSGQGYASARLSWQFGPDLPEFVNWSRQAQSYARSFVSFGHSLLFWQENDDVTPRDTPRHAGNLGSAE